MRALAARFFELELGIKSVRTVFSEHLYELEGFQRLFDPVTLEAVRAGAVTNDQLTALKIPEMTIGVERSIEDAVTFSPVVPLAVSAQDGVVVFRCSAFGGCAEIVIGLDFKNQRLYFDPFEGVSITDDGSAVAIEAEMARFRFASTMLGNGRTFVRSLPDGDLLGRTDPCIPMNIDVAASDRAMGERLGQLAKLLHERQRTVEAAT